MFDLFCVAVAAVSAAGKNKASSSPSGNVHFAHLSLYLGFSGFNNF